MWTNEVAREEQIATNEIRSGPHFYWRIEIKMRYVRGKGSRERRVHARSPPPNYRCREQQTASGLFRTVPDGKFCSRNLLSFMFGRAALHLSNQRPRGLASLSVQQRERERERGGREKEREAAQLLQFRFAYIRIRGVFDRHRQLRCGRQHTAGNEIILLLEYSSRYIRRIFYPFYR